MINIDEIQYAWEEKYKDETWTKIKFRDGELPLKLSIDELMAEIKKSFID